MKILGINGWTLGYYGQSKFALETARALRYMGHTMDFVTATDQKGNKDNFSATDIIEGSFIDPEFIDSVIEMSKNYDLIIVFSLIPNNSTDEAKDLFRKFLNSVDNKMIYVNVDHNKHVINNLACVEETCRRSDLVLVHSLDGTLVRMMKDWKIDTPVDYLYTSRDYSVLRNRYWRPTSDMNLKSATWIGRTTRWKKPDIFAEFAYDRLNHNGFTSTIEGIEMSIIYYSLFKYQRPVDFVDISRYKSGNHDNLEPGKCYLFNRYEFEEEMERLSHTGFGADLYTLKPNQYGRSLEQCHIDIVNCGCIPIFSKHFGENCLTISGNRYIDECPDIIYLDRDNFDECLDRMIELSSDPVLFDRTRDRIFEFMKTQSDISVVGPKLDEIVNRVVNQTT